MYAAYIVRRTQIYLQESQDERLAERAEVLGTTKSDVIREAIDLYLEGPPDEDARVARFRAALHDVARSPASLPEGRAYVERLRALESSRREALERRRR
jgi:predicted DNA-binding protein